MEKRKARPEKKIGKQNASDLARTSGIGLQHKLELRHVQTARPYDPQIGRMPPEQANPDVVEMEMAEVDGTRTPRI